MASLGGERRTKRRRGHAEEERREEGFQIQRQDPLPLQDIIERQASTAATAEEQVNEENAQSKTSPLFENGGILLLQQPPSPPTKKREVCLAGML